MANASGISGAKNNQVTVTGSLKFDISVTPQLAAKAVTLAAASAAIVRSGLPPANLRWRREYRYRRSPCVITSPRIYYRSCPIRSVSDSTILRVRQVATALRAKCRPPAPVSAGDTMGELMLWRHCRSRLLLVVLSVERGGHKPAGAAAHAIPVPMWVRIPLTLKIFAPVWIRRADLSRLPMRLRWQKKFPLYRPTPS